MYESEKDYVRANQVVNDFLEVSKNHYGPMTTQYAQACFLKAKTLMMTEGSDQEITLEHIKKAIDIEEEVQKSKA